MNRTPAVILASALLALAGCGDDESSSNGNGGGGSSQNTSERSAVEKAARDYVVDQQSDEDDTETAEAISFQQVDVNGDEADVKAKSTKTGNNYEATLRKSGGTWRGLTLLTDRPSEETPGGDASQGSGREISTDQVESQIEARVLKALGVSGKVDCPPTIRIRRGNNFECRVTGGDRKATVKVTQKDDQGNLNYKVTFKSSG